ncbi:MAG: PH domain-containing protein [Chitinophagales bacterium]
MVEKPKKAKGIFMGLILGVVFFGTVIGGVSYSLGPDDMILKMVLLVPSYALLALYLYLLFGFLTLKYLADDNGFTVKWATKRYFIPWSDLDGVTKMTGGCNLVNILGVSWPGSIAGSYIVKGYGFARVFANNVEEMLILSSKNLSLGISISSGLEKYIAERSGQELKTIDVFDLSKEETGNVVSEDLPYMILYALNIISILALAMYLAIFFPGSGANPMAVLLLSLEVALFSFNLATVTRLYHYMNLVAYLIWFIGLTINIVFFIMAFIAVGIGVK